MTPQLTAEAEAFLSEVHQLTPTKTLTHEQSLHFRERLAAIEAAAESRALSNRALLDQHVGGDEVKSVYTACTGHPACWLADGHPGVHEQIVNGKSVPIAEVRKVPGTK